MRIYTTYFIKMIGVKENYEQNFLEEKYLCNIYIFTKIL